MVHFRLFLEISDQKWQNGSCGGTDIFVGRMQGILEEVALLQEINEACRACVRAFVDDRTDSQGRVSVDALANFARRAGFSSQPWNKALKVGRLII